MGNILAPFKKFLSNKNTITILGVLLGVVVLFLGYRWRVNEAINPQTILYAKHTLNPEDPITAEDIGTTTISNSTLKNMTNVINNENDLVGKIVSFDSKIPANSYFFNESVMSPEEMPDSLFTYLGNGNTIYALAVNTHDTFGNSIFPDDTIDLYMTYKDENDQTVFGRLIKKIRVLAVKDDAGNNVFKNRDSLGTPSQLLFEVPEDLFSLLKRAELVGIQIMPVARNASYSTSEDSHQIDSQELQDVINAKSRAAESISGFDEGQEGEEE